MTRIEHISYRLLMMIELLVLSGCAMTMPTMSATTTVASLSYELPASVNAKTIVDILEESSTKVLKKPVTFDEAISDLSFANTVSPVLLREKVMLLEGLGNVAIPSIICPGALASMHTLLPGQTGLRLIAGCVVGNDASTRVYLTEAGTGESTFLSASPEARESLLLAQIGTALTERLPEAHAIEGLDIPIYRTSQPSVYDDARKAIDPPLAEHVIMAGHSSTSALAFPVECFSPKEHMTVVREHPGSNMIIGTLGSDLIVQEDLPGKNSFLHVTTREGRIGWVKRSDVRWTPCPVV
ncbi:SH3 domain-containing protein [Petrachloros mirabilis]